MAVIHEQMPETLNVSDDVRNHEIRILWEIWEMPPGGRGGGFPPIDNEKKYGGRPEPEGSSDPSFLRRALRGAKWLLKPGNMPEKSYPSGRALPDESGTIKGGFRLRNASDQSLHEWDAISGPMPDGWIESSSRRVS